MHRNLEVEKNSSDSQFIHRVGRPQRYLGGIPWLSCRDHPPTYSLLHFKETSLPLGKGGGFPETQ